MLGGTERPRILVNEVVVGYDCFNEDLGDPGPPDPSSSIVLPIHIHLRKPTVNQHRLPYGSPYMCVACSPDRNSVFNQYRGLVKRLLRVTPEPDPSWIEEFSEYVAKYCEKNFTPLKEAPDFDNWIMNEQKTYSLARRLELKKVWDGCNRVLSREDCEAIASFLKDEAYAVFKHPRWINSRKDKFKCYSGPWFHAIEQVLYRDTRFIKHVPVADRPALVAGLVQAGVSYCATDFTSFEAHFSPAIMRACELKLYQRFLSSFPSVSSIICRTLTGTNRGKTRSGVRFVTRGRRMSGDMCTSLGNGFTNLMIWSFLYDKLNPGGSWQGYVEGDDGIFAYSGKCPDSSMYRKLGFTIKIQQVTDPSLCSFCGIVSADGISMRNPGLFLATFGWSSSCVGCGLKKKNQLLKAKALSAVYETPSCPIINAIARRALVLTGNSRPRFEKNWYREEFQRAIDPQKIPPCRTTVKCRQVFSELYGIPVEVQIYIEGRILSGLDDSLFECQSVIRTAPDFLKMALSHIELQH